MINIWKNKKLSTLRMMKKKAKLVKREGKNNNKEQTVMNV